VTLPPYRIFLIAERQPNGRAVPEKKNSEILPERGKYTCTDIMTGGEQTKRNDHMSYQCCSQSSDHYFLNDPSPYGNKYDPNFDLSKSSNIKFMVTMLKSI